MFLPVSRLITTALREALGLSLFGLLGTMDGTFSNKRHVGVALNFVVTGRSLHSEIPLMHDLGASAVQSYNCQ